MAKLPFNLDPKRTALIIQGLQNDVIAEGGALEATGTAAHAKKQNIVVNVGNLAAAARKAGVPVIFIWFIAEERVGPDTNTPLWEMIQGKRAMVRGSWGASPVKGLKPQDGDFVVEKMAVQPFGNSRIDALLRGLQVNTLVITGALTNYSIVLTAAAASDLGYRVVACSDGSSSRNDDWHNAALDYEMPWIGAVATCAEVASAFRQDSEADRSRSIA